MTSDDDQVYVWVLLPGDVVPTLCARLKVTVKPGGASVAEVVYGRSYLEHPHAVALDPVRLPLASRAFKATSTPADGDPDVFGVIADACPDDWGRYVISRRHGEQRFPIGFLLRSQEDRAGNLCFSVERDKAPELREPVSVEYLDEAWAVVQGLETGRPLPPELENRVRANTGMGGARPKLTVSDGTHQWLAKFPSLRDDRSYSQARLEAATLNLAQRCGINAAKARLQAVRASDGQEGAVLLVKRFDRAMAPDSGGWLRDAYVSGRTLLTSEQTVGPGQYMGSYPQLATQFQRWSGNAAADRLELFRRMAFNCCVSNTDDHDRNHGLVASELGDLRLSPAFDIVPRVHKTKRRHHAMGIGDEGTLATVANLVSAAAKLTIAESDARAIVDDMQQAVAANWKTCLENHGMTAAELEVLAPCFDELPTSAADLDRIIVAQRSSWLARDDDKS
ncbi:type II toxin-antitoxin system HipA family toxin [Roseateles sp. DC23W]|uniref:Type II toxin-antitoxin system HipA family toxin n=2 Tax=Pelomonas dachongensis TaxID=3299029 RepID=A0ABW7EUD3_9BURK